MITVIVSVLAASLAGIIAYLLTRSMMSKKLLEAQMNLKSTGEKAELLVEEITGLKTSMTAKEADIDALREEKSVLNSRIATLEATLKEEQKSANEKLQLLEDAREKLSDAFKVLSQEALKSSSDSFIQLAESKFKEIQTEAKGDLEQRKQAVENLVNPIKSSLEKTEKLIQNIEKERKEEFGSLANQIKTLTDMEVNLQKETSNLVTALKAPQIRGSWGEQTLRRVVEMAGLNEYCDFSEQDSLDSAEGKLRPDLTIQLPGERKIVVDSKNIFTAYYHAVECTDEVKRNKYLNDHLKNVKSRIKELSTKAYWQEYGESAEYVILFMPNENFYIEAIKLDNSLFEEALKAKVILAHPVTLAALLQTVSLTWKQQKVNENSEIIRDLGKNLYDSLTVVSDHLDSVGKKLGSTVKAYNDTVGSFERNLTSKARKFSELGVSGKKEIGDVSQIESSPRQLKN